jgi:hypothetical protein
MSKCPYCYRTLGTWQKDPLLIPIGAKYDWSDDTHLVYIPTVEDRYHKGIDQISEPEVKELQDYLKNLEEENLPEIDWTEFSPLNTSGRFQITGKHIKEMRDSVEKLLDTLGLSFTDYFNYDEEGNHIIHPNGDKLDWTDPITTYTDLQKFQVKYIHIEDLRHYIQIIWIEKWEGFPDFIYLNDTHHVIGSNWTYNFPFIPVFGNKGDWNSIASATHHNTGLGDIEDITVISECDITSEKLTLRINSKNICIVPGSGGINAGIVNQTRIENSPNYILTSHTVFGFDLTNYIDTISVSGSASAANIFTVTVTVGGHNLSYSPTTTFSINLYDDYVSHFGIPAPGVMVTNIRFNLRSQIIVILAGDSGQSVLQTTLDNIKFSNVI